MRTMAWIMILVGLFTMRQAIKGRALKDIPNDIGDLLRGAATSIQSPRDSADIVKEVLLRQGPTLTYSNNDLANQIGVKYDAATGTVAGGNAQGAPVLFYAKQLAQAANFKYVWGASGPNGYDCSGLVWAAMKKLGYSGMRFTTYTFLAQMGTGVTANKGTPQQGDIVLWPSHMGIMEDDKTMFSALNPRDGIISSPLSYGPKGEGSPTFWTLHFAEKKKVQMN